MGTLLGALGFIAAVAVGESIAAGGIAHSAGQGVAALTATLTATVLVLGSVALVRGQRAGRIAMAGIVLAGLSRGLAREGGSFLVLSERAPAGAVMDLVVMGASTPGPRCRFVGEAHHRGGRYAVETRAEDCPLSDGNIVAVPLAQVHVASTPELPGDPDPRTLARRSGLTALIVTDRVWLRPCACEFNGYWRWVAEQRQLAWTLSRGDEARGLVVAAVLGLAAALDRETIASLRGAGLGHLVAVSGMNVAIAALMVYGTVLRLSAAVGRSVAAGVVLSWLPVVGYALLTGASPPAMRAALMLGMNGIAVLVGRPAHGLTALALAAGGLLAHRPSWISDPSFQLSFAAMTALVGTRAGGILSQTWRVTWAILPLSLWHFDDAPILGLAANLLAVPVFTLWVLPLGFLGWLGVPALGSGALAPAAWGAELILDVARLFRWLPVPGVRAIVGLLLIGVACFAAGSRWPGVRARAPGIVPLLSVVAVLAWPSPSPDTRVWYGVGGGRATSIISRAEDPRGRAIACVRPLSLGPERWHRLLDALGFSGMAIAAEGEPGPDVAALVAFTARRGRDRPDRDCRLPDARRVRAAVRRCRRRIGAPLVIVRAGRVPGSPAECFAGGRWVALEEEWPRGGPRPW